jgi:hypothetical protein
MAMNKARPVEINGVVYPSNKEEGVVVGVPRPGLRHRPQSAGSAESEALGTGRDLITALRRAGTRVEPIKRAPVPIAARDP